MGASGRGARRPRVGGGVRSGAAGRLQRAPPGQAALPGGRRRRRGLRAGDRVGPGGGSPRAALANRVAGFRARSLARRHAHTRGRIGGGSGARGAPDPRAPRVAGTDRGARRDAGRLGKHYAWALRNADIVFPLLEIGVIAMFCPGFPVPPAPRSS
ncbi:uncharacterized protein LOC121827990 [Peromyscus maniculatus bairdii]|uniref:uncharacterized protein LOC121827990 n=1 Tax=Peromyscus maniculatus bairdii TaxID=230844 RepID=UPI003FD1C3A1